MSTQGGNQQLLTVVIPVHNREATLPRTLASIAAQTVSPTRIILVDNGSTDSSLSILHSWAAGRPGVTVVSEPRPGACAARNRGLGLVDTPWVMFFDSDDVMLPAHIARFTAAITARGHEADIIGASVMANLPGSRRKKLLFTTFRPLFSHIFLSCMSTQRYVARTDLVRRAGGWNESLTAWNDYELGVRLLLRSPRIIALKGAPTAEVCFTPGSLTGSSFSAHPERWESSLAAIRAVVPTRVLPLVEARAMILSEDYRREGAPDEAARLRSEVLARSPHLTRRLCAVARFHRLMGGRFGWAAAALLM